MPLKAASLAYVGMTRARDTIIVAVPPSAPRNDAWIRSFESEHLLATGDVLALPKGEPIPSGCRALADAEPASPSPSRTGASMCSRIMRTGRLVQIDGNRQVRGWKNACEYSDRFSTEIRLVPGERLQFLDTQNGSGAPVPNAQAPASGRMTTARATSHHDVHGRNDHRRPERHAIATARWREWMLVSPRIRTVLGQPRRQRI